MHSLSLFSAAVLNLLFFWLTQEFQWFSPLLGNSGKKKPQTTQILEPGEFDKTQGLGFSVKRIMLESAAEICTWNLSLRNESHTSDGFGNYTDKAFEMLPAE